MTYARLFAPLLIIAGFVVSPYAHAQSESARIWNRVPLMRAGDYQEFESVLGQTRAEGRRRISAEFMGMLMPLAYSTDDLVGLASVLGEMLLTFDDLARRQREDAHRGIQKSLEAQLLSEFDTLFEKHRLPDRLRRASFVAPSEELLEAAGRGELTPEQSERLLASVDHILYGTYTVLQKGQVLITLTLENLRSGALKNFQAKGRIETVMRDAAQTLFDFFQSNRYAEWVNPHPQIEWIALPGPQTKLPAATAKSFCSGQNARLPYAREYIQASLGTEYRSGGIPRLRDYATYVVADRQRYDVPHFFTAGARAFSQTGGPVHTEAGHGRLTGFAWCVRGEPSREVNLVESIYRLIRITQADPAQTRTTAALEYLLIRLDDFGQRPWFENTFRSTAEALSHLRAVGITIDLPEGL